MEVGFGATGQCAWETRAETRGQNPHFLISFWNHSSSGAQPQKRFPSPPRSHWLVISYWRMGSFSKWWLCINTCSCRRNLRWLTCFPRFCDLQQQQVPAGILFLLLLIFTSNVMSGHKLSLCHSVKHYEAILLNSCFISDTTLIRLQK